MEFHVLSSLPSETRKRTNGALPAAPERARPEPGRGTRAVGSWGDQALTPPAVAAQGLWPVPTRPDPPAGREVNWGPWGLRSQRAHSVPRSRGLRRPGACEACAGLSLGWRDPSRGQERRGTALSWWRVARGSPAGQAVRPLLAGPAPAHLRPFPSPETGRDRGGGSIPPAPESRDGMRSPPEQCS